MRPLLGVLLLALPLAGCTLVKDPEPRELAGPTDGYTPTANYLKLHLRRDDGSVAFLDFDRREWYAAGIAKMVDRRDLEFVHAQALPRDILNEYLVQQIAAPDSLAALHYDEMGASAEQRAQMDSEYETLLRAALETAPAIDTPSAPTVALPADALP